MIDYPVAAFYGNRKPNVFTSRWKGGVMDLTKRQGAILDLLLRGTNEATLGSMASELGVSARTVHREIARLAVPLRRDFSLVLSGRSGHGLSVMGTQENIDACRAHLDKNVSDNLDPEDRRRMLALMLLDASDALKTFALTYELDITTVAVRHDLDILRPWFGLYALELTARKGLGVLLEGAESSRRQALCSIIMEHYGEAGLLDLIREEAIAKPVKVAMLRTSALCNEEPRIGHGELVLRLFPPEPFREAERVLSGLTKHCLPALAPRDYLGLVIHLGVASSRRRQGHRLEDGAFLVDQASPAAEFDTGGVARAVIAGMSRIGALPDDPVETRSVERFLRGAKPERTLGGLSDSGIGTTAEAIMLMEECGRELECNLLDDRVLRDGLAAHWGPAFYRVRNHFPIRNPMLKQIISEYSTLFSVIRASCTRVFPGVDIPDDEIGYLVLHFGSAIARKRSNGDRFRALVVCSAGIGSARMLASRIKAELPQIEIVANLSWFDVTAVSRDRWDILVSTIPLPLDPGEYVLVDPLLSAQGLKALQAHVAARKSRVDTVEKPDFPPQGDTSLAELKLRSRQLQAVIGVLERLTVFRDARCGDDWDGFLYAAIERCAGSGLLHDKDAAFRDLQERSRDFGILLPSSRVLFLHARSEGVSTSSLSLHAFADGIQPGVGTWESMPTRLALMLAPRSLDRETQDILNEISVSLLDAGTIEVLQAADEASIKYHYSRYLDRYFRSIPSQGA